MPLILVYIYRWAVFAGHLGFSNMPSKKINPALVGRE
jgi:hypothetical protein